MSYDPAEDDVSRSPAEEDNLASYGVYHPAERFSAGPLAIRPPRYSDSRTDWRTRSVGMGGTAMVFLAIFAAAFLSWRTLYPVRTVSEPLAVSLQPLSSPDTVQEVPDGPVMVEQQPARQRRPLEMRPPLPLRDAPSEPVSSEPAADPSPPAKPVTETRAPKSIPAPPARQASSNISATWEAQLLAHLEKYRRYPAAARARREQGVVHVRFRMSREGRLLSAEVLRSSGSTALDRAALDTVRRAQPLPAIPPEKPDPLELSVPVEFFVKRQ